jgi:Trypsin-like peptidase domain
MRSMPIYGPAVRSLAELPIKDVGELNPDLPEAKAAPAVGLLYVKERGIPSRTRTLATSFTEDRDDGSRLKDHVGSSLVLAPYYQSGTCFLVDRKCIVTAHHVIEDLVNGGLRDLATLEVVFDARHKPSGRIDWSESFSPTRIVVADPGRDLVMLELDRPVAGRTPLPVEFDSNAAVGARLCILGYPLAWPLKCGYGRVVANGGNQLDTRVDAFICNSGSPVVRIDTNEVVGIYSASTDDFAQDGALWNLNFVDPALPGAPSDTVRKIPREWRTRGLL